MFRKPAVLLVAVSMLVCSIAVAEEAKTVFLREAVGIKAHPAAPRILQRLDIAPAARLRPAVETAIDELQALRTWNEEGRLPARNGITRSLGETLKMNLDAVTAKSGLAGRGAVNATSGGTTWGMSIQVDNAQRLRLHLENVELPAGATLWVYGKSGEAIAFDSSLRDPAGSLWTPSVNGDTLHLEVEIPNGATASFEAREVLELLHPSAASFRSGADDEPTCLVDQDVNCQSSAEFPAIAAAKAAVARMEFSVPGGGAYCSGTLINDQNSSGTPYFLTAAHCISTQSSASSLEAYFDSRYVSCISGASSELPAVNGSTLLVTSSPTDVTLLRLSSVPANRALLGWSTTPPSTGTRLHRISHPVPDGFPGPLPQMYSRTIVTTASCTGIPRPNYIYSNESSGGEGGVYGGSSGSAIILSDNSNDARIVGQLRGSCGCPDPSAACDRRCSTIDGAFSESFNALRTHLAPTGTGPQPCTPNSSTICLVNNRFSVRLTYDVGQGPQPMTAIKYTGETGLFWFTDAGNIEVLLKMINACSFNQKFWVYAGGTTDVGVNITVTDSQNGAIKTYTNVRGTKFVTITDGSAFSCP